jgi:hypothetical protein
MGIQDRDYMKRPSDNHEDASDQRLEAFFSGLLRRYPRLPWVVGGVLAALILGAILLAALGG